MNRSLLASFVTSIKMHNYVDFEPQQTSANKTLLWCYTKLSNLYNKEIMSTWISANLKKHEASLITNWIECFWQNTWQCKYSTLCTCQISTVQLFCLLNWKFISRVRFEDMEDIKRNIYSAASHYIKRSFKSALTNEKPLE